MGQQPDLMNTRGVLSMNKMYRHNAAREFAKQNYPYD